MCCQKPKSGHFAGHSPVTGCIRRLPASFVMGRSPAHSISCRLCICRSPAAFLAKKCFVSKYLHFRLNEKKRLPVTKLKFLLTCWRLRNSCQSCWNRKKMVGAKKWSKMKPMVENNLTTFFWSDMGTDFLTIDNLTNKCWREHFFSYMCCQKPKSGQFAGHRLHSPVTG